MIIQLKNFGPIEHFEFDTEKQMHFIFGENNIGKSYAISAVYLILKNWQISKNFSISDYDEFLTERGQVNEKMKTFKQEIDISNEFISIAEQFLQSSFLPALEKSLNNSFSSISKLYNKKLNSPFEIHIKTELSTIEINQKDNHLNIRKISFNKNLTIKQDEKEPSKYIFNLNGSDVSIRSYSEIQLLVFIFTLRMVLNKGNSFSNIFFLPASRSGLYNTLSGFSSIIVQLTQLRNQIPNLKFEIPNLSEPIADYFLNISNINSKGYKTPFSQLAKQMEDNIIKGKINFDKSNRKLYYEPANLDLSLELSEVSSMIAEISPIIAHLKFLFEDKENGNAKGDNFLFIEEPEAHLHPKIQVELIKLFAELAKKGLKIVMTSHSNYLFNKLSNMILAKEVDPNTITVAHMKMGQKGSYIDKDSMKMDTEGIEDDNFSDVAEELYMERLKLYEQTH